MLKHKVLSKDDGPEGDLKFKPRVFAKTIYVKPCSVEHWISTDLFKFRLYAKENHLHVIGFCTRNYIPHYSLFCDEVILLDSRPQWYEGHSLNGFGRSIKRAKTTDIEGWDGLRREFSQISDKWAIEHFRHRKVCVLQSAYEKFQSLNLPGDRLICEVKPAGVGNLHRKHLSSLNLPMISGVYYDWQLDLLGKTGPDNYMSVQILGSKHLNWQYLCGGGSSNLFAVIPAKTIFLSDRTINASVKNIVAGLSPCSDLPVCNSEQRLDSDFIRSAFDRMSQVNIDFDIEIIEDSF